MQLRKTLVAGTLLAATSLAALPAALAAGGQETYQPSKEAVSLYEDFVRSSDKTSIAAALADAMGSDDGDDGVLILVTGDGIYGYRRKDRKRVVSIPTRSDTENGSLEMTAVSHVGPAVAYLAKLKELGEDWQSLAKRLVEDIDAFRAVNAAKDHNWLDRVDAPAWKGRHAKIRDMVDYAMGMASRYVQDQLASGGAGFTLEDVNDRFFDRGFDGYPIGFGNVMVATFSLATLNGAYATAQGLREAGLDWSTVRVLFVQKVGSNIGAGLTLRTNWTARLLLYVAGDHFSWDRVLIVPYADRRDSIGKDELKREDFTYYDSDIWQTITQRITVADAAFAEIPSIATPLETALPGDWGFTDPGDIGGFLERLKYTFGHSTELLSNATGFWIAGALAAAGWDPETITIPGLDDGFPGTSPGYPPLAGFPETDK